MSTIRFEEIEKNILSQEGEIKKVSGGNVIVESSSFIMKQLG